MLYELRSILILALNSVLYELRSFLLSLFVSLGFLMLTLHMPHAVCLRPVSFLRRVYVRPLYGVCLVCVVFCAEHVLSVSAVHFVCQSKSFVGCQ